MRLKHVRERGHHDSSKSCRNQRRLRVTEHGTCRLGISCGFFEHVNDGIAFVPGEGSLARSDDAGWNARRVSNVRALDRRMKEISNSVYCHPGAICKVCNRTTGQSRLSSGNLLDMSVAKETGSDSQYHFGGIRLVRWLSVARAAPFRRIGHTQARHGNRHTSPKGRCKTLSRSVRGFANTANDTIAYHAPLERGASRDGLINRTDSSAAQGPSSSFLATSSFGQTFGH